MAEPGHSRVAYLGPAGTFTEDALRTAIGDEADGATPAPTIFDAIDAVVQGRADRALVPFENSIEGAVRSTLDALAFDAPGVTIIGELDFEVRHCLIAPAEIEPAELSEVLSHPQATAQCARFLREEAPNAAVVAAPSTAEAVRIVCTEGRRGSAALGARSAAELYGGVILREGVEDEAGNVTRFVWIAREGAGPAGEGPWRTTLVFSELGEDHPGALVEALRCFSDRGVNLTRIESRPLRRGLGRYMFFVDLEGALSEAAVDEAVRDLGEHADSVRVLGTYPIASP